jgi:diacylglycerol kinase (ATP)
MYALATMQTIARHFGAPHLEMLFDGHPVSHAALLLAIGVGPRAGGGFFLTPEASHHDGLLDSCTVVPVSRLTMLAMLPRVMKGTHVTSPHVRMRRNRAISIESEVPLPIHIDGEVFAFPADEVHRLTVTSAPGYMRVMGDARPA